MEKSAVQELQSHSAGFFISLFILSLFILLEGAHSVLNGLTSGMFAEGLVVCAAQTRGLPMGSRNRWQ